MNSVTGGQSTEDKQRQTVADLARKKVMEAFHQGEHSAANQNIANVVPTRVISSTAYNQNLASTPPTTSANSATTKPSKNSLFNLISKAQKKLKDLTQTTETYAKNSFKHPSTEVSKLQTSTNATTNQPSLTDRPVYQNFATQKTATTGNPFRRTYQIQTGINRHIKIKAQLIRLSIAKPPQVQVIPQGITPQIIRPMPRNQIHNTTHNTIIKPNLLAVKLAHSNKPQSI